MLGAVVSLTVVLAVAVFGVVGSGVVDVTVAVLVSVPVAVGWTTSVKLAVPIARLPSVQVTVPVLPTAGVVQLQPAGVLSDWKAAVTVSLRVTLLALTSPPLLTVSVYVTVLSISAEVGAAMDTDRLAAGASFATKASLSPPP